MRRRYAPAALTAAVRASARFDRRAVSVTAGLLAAIPVAGVFGIALAASDPVAAATMGAGAMLVGNAWRTGGGPPPLGVMTLDAVGLALATFVGSVTGATLALHTVVLLGWAAAGGLLVALGPRGAALGTQAVIAFVVFGRFSEPAGEALGLAGLVLAGGLAQVLFSTVVRWPLPLRGQRSAVADAFTALAAMARAPLPASGLPAATALDDAERALSTPALLRDTVVLRLRTLVDEGRRARLELNAVRILLRQLARTPAGGHAAAADPAVASLLAQTATALHQAADAVRGDRAAAATFAQLTRGITQDAATLASAAPPTALSDDPAMAAIAAHLAQRLGALAGQLRVVAALLPAAGAGGRLVQRRPSAGAIRPLRALRAGIDELRANASLRSPAGRHAVRLAVVVTVTELLARHVPLARSYWMVVAAATVLRPEFGATFTRGAERTLGTALGVALAGAIAVGLHPGTVATAALVAGLAWAAYAVFPASFTVGFAFITTMVVFLLDVVSPDTLATAGDRLLDALAGGAIGLLAYALWPTWSHETARRALGDLVDAQRAYLHAVLDCLHSGAVAGEGTMRPLVKGARLARTLADAALAHALRDPATRRIDADRAQAMLATLRRLIEATHVLRLYARERGRAQLADLAPFAARVDAALAGIGTLVRTHEDWPRDAPAPAGLRESYDRFARSEPAPGADSVLLAELDEVVDTVDGLAALVGWREAGVGAGLASS